MHIRVFGAVLFVSALLVVLSQVVLTNPDAWASVVAEPNSLGTIVPEPGLPDVTPDPASFIQATPSPPEPGESPTPAPTIQATAPITPSEWITLTTGIAYEKIIITGTVPNRVFVARMDRSNPNLTIEAGLPLGKLSTYRDTTSNIAKRYDGSLTSWNGFWNTTSDVVVAINGSYFDENTGLPLMGVIAQGWQVKRQTVRDNDGTVQQLVGGFAWREDRLPFIGQCVLDVPAKQRLTFPRTGATMYLDELNLPHSDTLNDELILYTPQFGAATPALNNGVEVVLEVISPTKVVRNTETITGFVRLITDDPGNVKIPFDHVVLSAIGSKASKLLNNVQLGDEIGITQVIDHDQLLLDDQGAETCISSNLPPSWAHTYASINGHYHFVRDGEIYPYLGNAGARNRNPRTAVAFDDHYIYFIVVDGRRTGFSYGMTIAELGEFALSLGVTNAIAQDGGGSSTLWINGEVVNTPSDWGHLVYLPQVGKATGDEPQPGIPPVPIVGVERPVPNALMMAVVAPITQSEALTPGAPVVAISDTILRQGPGDNFQSFGSIAAGTSGTVVDHPSHNGVSAKGSYWWMVDFGSNRVGWVRQELLAPAGP